MTTDDQALARPTAPDAVALAAPEGASGQTARGLAKATALSLGLRVAGVLVGVITTSVLARYLEPAGYGLLSLAMTLGTAAAQFADLGVTQSVASMVAREPAKAGRILGTGLAMRSAVATLAAVGLVAAALTGLFGASSGVIAIVALAAPLSAAGVLTAAATARFRPEVASILALLQGLAWFAAVWAVVLVDGDVLTMAWCFVGAVVLQTAIGVAMNRRIVPIGRPSRAQVGRVLSLSWPLALTALAGLAYYRLNSLILFQARGADEVGYFLAAYKLLDVAQLAPAIIVAPLLPLVATTIGKDLRYREMILSLATRSGVLVGVGSAVLMVTLAAPAIDLIYGDQFARSVRPLMLLAVAFVWITLGWIGSAVCTALGRVRAIAAVTVSAAVLSVPAQLWACPRWGAVGAATVSAATELVVGGGVLVLAARAMSSPLPIGRLLAAVGSGAAIVVAALLLDWPPIVEGVLAGLVFVGAAFAARVVAAEDLRRILSRRAI